MSLQRLLEQATPGPWHMGGDEFDDPCGLYGAEGAWVMEEYDHADYRLVALAPDLAKLAIDMADELARVKEGAGDSDNAYFRQKALLALLAVLLMYHCLKT